MVKDKSDLRPIGSKPGQRPADTKPGLRPEGSKPGYRLTDSPEPLSGFEAGRLILQEAHLRSIGKGRLDNQAMQALRENVKTEESLDTFNRIMEAGKLIEIILLKAHIYSLEAMSSLQAGYSAILAILYPAKKPLNALMPAYQEQMELYQLSEGLKNDPERLVNIGNTFTYYLQVFKAFGVVVGDLARVLNIPEYLEEVERLKQRITIEVKNFNILAGVLRKLARNVLFRGIIPLPEPINFDRLKPDSYVVKAWRNQLAAGQGQGGLGKKWWKQEASGND